MQGREFLQIFMPSPAISRWRHSVFGLSDGESATVRACVLKVCYHDILQPLFEFY